MRWHWVAAAVLLGGVVWWTASQSGGDSDGETDSRAVRDEIAASPAVIATFVAAGSTDVTFTFTLVRGEGWVWSGQPSRFATPDISNRLVFNGRDYFLGLRAGCSVATWPTDPPIIPGLYLAERLVATLPQERRDATTVAYNVDIGGSRSLSVTEDLAAVETSGWFRAKTAGLGPRALIGEFTIRAATGEERTAATRVIRESTPSDTTRIELDQRYLFLAGGASVLHQTLLVAADCPDLMAIVSSPDQGARHVAFASGIDIVPGTTPTTRAIPFDVSIDSPEALLLTEARSGVLADVPIRVGARFFTGSEEEGRRANEVTACDPKPWFAC